jgi:hypothetical protein
MTMSRKNSREQKAIRRALRAQSKTPRVVAKGGYCPSCGEWRVLDLSRAHLCGRCAKAFEAAMFFAALQTVGEAENG